MPTTAPRSLSRLLPWLAAASLLVACDSASDTRPLVDETGYLVADLIRYTADRPLSATRATVLVVGLPGAVTTAGGELTASSPGEPNPLPAVVADDGAFVVAVAAAAGEVVTLRYVLDGKQQLLDVPLSDELDTVPTPIFGGGSSGAQFSVQALGDGTVSVDLTQLVARTTDVIVVNEDAGSSRRAAPSEASAVLPGESGDRVCVFALAAAADTASPTLCATAL